MAGRGRGTTRAAAHAGSWYSNDDSKLHEQLVGWLTAARDAAPSVVPGGGVGVVGGRAASGGGGAGACGPAPEGAAPTWAPPAVPIRAVIAPHAGYSYSGPTAAFAYAQVAPEGIRRVFILGPSHHVALDGCALTSATHLATPLGPLVVDVEVTRDLLSTVCWWGCVHVV